MRQKISGESPEKMPLTTEKIKLNAKDTKNMNEIMEQSFGFKTANGMNTDVKEKIDSQLQTSQKKMNNSDTSKLAKSVMTSLRKELVLSFIKHKYQHNSVDHDLQEVIDTFFADNNDNEEDLDSLISKDLNKLFSLIETKNSILNSNVKAIEDIELGDTPLNLKEWSSSEIKAHIQHMNNPNLTIKEQEKYINIYCDKLFFK